MERTLEEVEVAYCRYKADPMSRREGYAQHRPLLNPRFGERALYKAADVDRALPNQMGFRTLSCRLMQVGRKRHPLLDGCRDDCEDRCT